MSDLFTNPTEPSTLFQKLTKAGQYIRAYNNWMECWQLRRSVGKPTGEIRTIQYRNGLRMQVRAGTPDICILSEVLMSGAYASLEKIVTAAKKPCAVIDLGANIGAFTMRCAVADSGVHVYCYEPGPQNAQILQANITLNPKLSDRIHFYQEAAAGQTGTARWTFNEENPGGSALTHLPQGIAVQTRRLDEILARCNQPVALVKVDIEGSEYELLDSADKQTWVGIPAVMTELHDDPAGKATPAAWLNRMKEFGFTRQVREFSTLLLTRD